VGSNAMLTRTFYTAGSKDGARSQRTPRLGNSYSEELVGHVPQVLC